MRGLTILGKQWGQAGAPPLADLPVTEYADYKAILEAAYEEGFSPTTESPVEYWAESSGTTAATPKRFPYVRANAKQRMASFGPLGAWLYRLSVAEPHIPLKPVLVVTTAGSPPAVSPGGVPKGYATGYLFSKRSALVDRAMVVPRVVNEDPELWQEWAPFYAVVREPSLIMGLSPAWIEQFYKSLLARMGDYWPYLEGRALPSPLPSVIIGRDRLSHLREVFRNGPPTMREVWPNLATVTCWTSASSAAQVPLVEPWLGGVTLRDYPYAGTEALLTVPIYDGVEGHPLHPAASTIVELLPEDAEPHARNLLPCWQAQEGKCYEVFLTSLSGLIRYRLHDIVKCTGHFHRTPRLVFRSKTAFILKVTSTAIPEDEVVQLLRRIGYLGRDDLLVGPDPSGRAFAMYVREGSSIGSLAEPFEQVLMQTSNVYRVERRKGVLSAVNEISVPATHPMWGYRARLPAKSRYVLPRAPRDL